MMLLLRRWALSALLLIALRRARLIAEALLASLTASPAVLIALMAGLLATLLSALLRRARLILRLCHDRRTRWPRHGRP